MQASENNASFDLARRLLLKGTVASAALGITGFPARASSGVFNPEALSRLRTTMEGHVADGTIPGAVWLLHRHGETHAGTAGTYEMGGGPPMARDTIFRIASITKPLTAVAAMTLVEHGVLGLDDPVDPFLPELANPRVLASVDAALNDTVPAARPVTLRDLLTQRFGLGAIMVFPEKYPIQAAMREAGIAPGPQLPAMPPDEYMKRLGELPLAYQPGEEFLYNNGLDMAGVLIARASGKSLGDSMRERIFAPLGMSDTAFFVPEEKIDRLPTLYGRNFQTGEVEAVDAPDGSFASPPAFESGAGGLVSTVDDYLAFCRMMLNGGELDGARILKPETVAEMTRDQLTAEQKQSPNAVLFTHDGGAGWGLGTSVAIKRTAPWMTPGRFGWDGGYGTSAYTDPKAGLIGIFLSQKMMDSPEPPKTYTDFWTQAYKAV